MFVQTDGTRGPSVVSGNGGNNVVRFPRMRIDDERMWFLRGTIVSGIFRIFVFQECENKKGKIYKKESGVGLLFLVVTH